MSRCFPFPPPGYERKTKSDDVDTFKEEKDRERKHKKEKDKGKREGKERREKDRSDGKHKDKKNKREKQRDKKKHKEKRDKHERSNLDQKRTQVQPESEGQGGERITASKKLTLFPEDCSGEKTVHRRKDWEKETCDPAVEKRPAGLSTRHSGEKIGKNSHHAISNNVSKSVWEYEKSGKDEDEGPANLLAEKFMGSHQKNNGRMVRLDPRLPWTGKGQINKDTGVDDRKINGQQFNNDRAYAAYPVVRNFGGTAQTAFEGMRKVSARNTENIMEGKEKKEETEVDEKCQDKDRAKRAQERERARDKEKVDITEEKRGHKPQMHDKSKESNEARLLNSHNIKFPHLPGDNKKSGVVEGSVKRKVVETNGPLHGNDKRPNKLLRPALPCHPLTQNGRFLDSCQISHHSTSNGLDLHEALTDVKVDDKEHAINAVIKSQPVSCSLKALSSANVQDNQTVEDTRKLPHPDLKYLNKVLLVPDMEALPDVDDQEWWLSGSHCRSDNVEPSVVETAEVWAAALRIDAAGFFALPYVIPY